MIRYLLAIVLFALCAGSALAAGFAPPMAGGPVPVTVLIYVLDLDSIDSAEQVFTANVYLEYTWSDPRLVHDGDGPVFKGMDEIWQPNLQVLNQQKLWSTFPERFEVFPDGRVRYRQRVWGDFSQPLDLRDYPADHQALNIQLVAAGLTPDQVELVPSSEGGRAISADLSVADFEITGSEVVVEPYNPLGSSRGASSIRSTYFASRKIGYFIVKVILPLMLIVVMSWSVFWIDPSESGTQIGVATTSMLTLIAFRFAVDASLPKISYLTRLDAFILASTALVFLSLFEVVTTSRLAKTGRLEQAVAWDRWSRLVFPAAFVAVTVWSFAA